MTHHGVQSWSAYWAESHEAMGCLPYAPAAINNALLQFWSSIAEILPRDAIVVDVCCGNGAVLRALQKDRADIRLSGYDFANVDAQSKTFTLHGGIDCANLPLSNASVSAVTSQFGLEYADPTAINETLRVVTPDGLIALIVHHSDSILVKSNGGRLDALSAFLNSGLFEEARHVANGARTNKVDLIMANLAVDHTGQPVIGELFRGLQLALQRGPAALKMIAAIQSRAHLEKLRLLAMREAAKDMSGLTAMLAPLQRKRRADIRELRVDGHGIIGWSVVA